MSCPSCESAPCVCRAVISRHPMPFVRENHVDRPQGISQEEFSVELFEAIKSVGGIQALDEQICNYRQHAMKRADAQTRRSNLLTLLKEQRDQLTVPQTLELVSRYPWVASV